MTNSESLGAESATEPTTKPESDAMNMSAGAEMLIARMKTNPDDFKYGGRFYRVVEAMNAPHGQGWVSERDQEALRLAYGEHIQEAEFSEWVYNEIFNPKEPEKDLHKMYAQAQGQKAQIQRAMQGAMLTGTGYYGAAIQPGMAVGLTDTNATSTSVFKSIKNTLGI
jgi:hypothetical protein